MFRLKVREIANKKNISQRQLFLRSGVDIRTVRRIFHDPHAVITVETLERLARVLEVDVSELIESIPDNEQRSNGDQPLPQDEEGEDDEG